MSLECWAQGDPASLKRTFGRVEELSVFQLLQNRAVLSLCLVLLGLVDGADGHREEALAGDGAREEGGFGAGAAQHGQGRPPCCPPHLESLCEVVVGLPVVGLADRYVGCCWDGNNSRERELRT